MTASVVQIHDDYWRKGGRVDDYASRTLFPPEVVILARYHQTMSAGRVLELGCGAGRLLGYLTSLSRTVEAIDLSEAMLAHCRTAYPEADVHYGDLGALHDSVEGPFEAMLAPFNVLGGLEDTDRRRVMREIRELLAPNGLFIFSSHNLEHALGNGSQPHPTLISRIAKTPPERVPRAVARIPHRWLSRRRLRPLEYRAGDHAIIGDTEGDGAVLHYYIGHAAQERQLHQTGYELLDCLDVEGRTVPTGVPGKGPWLYYVARPAGGAPGNVSPENAGPDDR